MEILQVASVPVIATLVYWIINLVKSATNNNEKFKRLIPLISAGLGAVLGVIAFYAVPNIVVADNVFVAVIIGGASGLSATGANQIMKQLSKTADGKTETQGKDKK